MGKQLAMASSMAPTAPTASTCPHEGAVGAVGAVADRWFLGDQHAAPGRATRIAERTAEGQATLLGLVPNEFKFKVLLLS